MGIYMDTVILCIWSNKKCISASKYMVDGLLRLFYQQFSEVSEMSGTGDSVPCNKTEITNSVPFCAATGLHKPVGKAVSKDR